MKDATTIILDFNKHIAPQAQLKKFTAIQESPFRFYRGTCHLFYDRLAALGAPKDKTSAWICGDLHLENFGSYKGNNRLVYFDLNDFDEALLAPLSMEVLRFATAILMASGLFKYSAKDAKALVLAGLSAYRDAIVQGKALMVERENATGIMKDFLEHLSAEKRKAFIRRITVPGKNKKLQFKIDNIHSQAIDAEVRQSVMAWYTGTFAAAPHLKHLQVIDCAGRIAGTGSIGAERYMLLVQSTRNSKYYLLDMKEAFPSSLRSHVAIRQPKWANEAARVVSIQERMQFCAPALLQPVQYNGKWFVLKELQPVQDKIDLACAKGDLHKLEDIVLPMARLAAYAHLRGTGRQGSATADELAAAVSRPKWLNKRFDMAQELADQTNQDYKDFLGYNIG